MTKPKETIISQVELAGEGVHWDLEGKASYGGYLRLDRLLSAQSPNTDAPDELMFIVAHQVSELWIKLVLHEVGSALSAIKSDNLRPSFKMLSRATQIQRQLLEVWSVVSTMTPADYAQFRDQLGSSSGFQSHQYRMLEFALGNKNAAMVKVHSHDPAVFDIVTSALEAPSIYDETLGLLHRRGLSIPANKLDRNWSEPYVPDNQVEEAWAHVYENSAEHWELYELGEKLMDIEDSFQQWRFRHMKTVSRIIGMRRGTGGTSGVSYLKRALDLRFFPELWTVRTRL